MYALRRLGLTGLIVLVLLATFSLGTYVGYTERPAIDLVRGIDNKEIGQPAGVDFSEFWRAWVVLREKYAGDAVFDNQEAVYGAIDGMVRSLGDPYTTFFPPKEKEIFDADVKGEFSGIGAEIGMRKEILTIIAPLKDSPAERAGLKSGDRILKIDDAVTADMSVEEAVLLIRGPRGSMVKLTVLREGENATRLVEVTRDIIRIPVLETEARGNGVFVIRLYNFSQDSPYEFRKAVREAVAARTTRLVLDLRNNPGGYLEAAVDIASWFLKAGEVVAREDFGDGKEEIYRSKGYGVLDEVPVVVLLNEGSASASEILAGALRDNRHIPLVGIKSFGKGSVQELVDLTDRTSLKVTIARWLTPRGVSLSKEGLEPDIKVEITPEDAENGRDPQLEQALKVLIRETLSDTARAG